MSDLGQHPIEPAEPSYRKRLPAGVIDSAFAAFANFAVGLTAVNLFDDVNRGVYAVYFAAFILGGVIPRYLIYTPAEVQAVSYPVERRLAVFRESLVLGIGPAAIGSLAAVAAFFVTSGYATPEVNNALLATSALAMALSPMQDHARALFHIAAESWSAVAVSVIQFTTVAVSLVSGILLDLPIAWVPFGALCIANGISLTAAWIISKSRIREAAPDILHFRSLASKGRWLVVHAIAPPLAGFAVMAIIYALSGPEDAGYAESARVVAQPVLVLATGLAAVLAPRSMRAAMDLDRATARHTLRVFVVIIGIAGGAYFAVASVDWVLNPMAYLVPSAYVVPGLAAVSIVATLFLAPLFIQTAELLGARKERQLAVIAFIANPLQILIGFSAAFIGPFARPVSLIAEASSRLVLQRRVLRSVYGGHDDELSSGAEDGGLSTDRSSDGARP